VIVWLDGTIEITYDKTSNYILEHIYDKKIIGWHHEQRNGILKSEVEASDFQRYTSTFWNEQEQPYQDIYKQYEHYVEDGYTDLYYEVKNFLDLWYLQTLKFTQDQISFSYVCHKTNLIPFTQ